jgi:hypothetical protein
MGFEKKQTFCVVVGSRGEREVLEGLPGDDERVDRTVEATSLLAAYKEAFGTLPDLDPGIRELVVVLNEIPGMRTWSSCEGHKRHGDPCASISMQFENLTALEHFVDLVSFVKSDEVLTRAFEDPPVLDLCLEIDLAHHLGDGLPVSCELFLGRFPMDRAEPGKPPGARALRAFAKELRRRAAARFPGAVSGAEPS